MKRRALILFALAAVLLTVAASVGKAYTYRHFYDGYDSQLPLNAAVTEPVVVDKPIEAFHQELRAHFREQRVEIDARPGDRVPALLTLPIEAAAPVPAIVLLHGSHQEKEFVEEIATPFNEAGFAVLCFDQYIRGERKVRGSVLTMMRAYRERCWKTVQDARRMIDYLQTRPDIDTKRIYLIGASYGAIEGTAVLAQDKRIKAGVLVVGGGNWRLLAKAPEVRREIPGWLLPFAAPLVTLAMGPADPIRHAAQTAGIPVLMQNGSNDGVVIPEAGKALYAALGEPKEIRWYPVDHPDREKNGKEVIRMLDEGLQWMIKQDAAIKLAQSR